MAFQSALISFIALIAAGHIISDFNSGIEDSTGSFFAGAGIVQTFSINDEYKGKDISGNRLSLLFQLGVGW